MTQPKLIDRFTVRNFPADSRKKLNLYCIEHETQQAVVLAQALREYLANHQQSGFDAG